MDTFLYNYRHESQMLEKIYTRLGTPSEYQYTLDVLEKDIKKLQAKND